MQKKAVYGSQTAPGWVYPLRRDLEKMAEELTAGLIGWHGPEYKVTPEEMGYSGEGMATEAIQAAVDRAASSGGGTVVLGAGSAETGQSTNVDYVSGTIVLRSNVRLWIEKGTRLLGSLNLSDYPDHVARRRTVMDTNMGMNQSLIFAEGCRNIGIGGPGMIDGRGLQENFPGGETVGGTPGRPFLIRIIDCQDVHIDGITLKDAACWMENYLNCDRLLIENVHVENQANYNNDGIDIDGCRDVVIRNCTVHSGDDGLCFKGCAQTECARVLVEDCELLSSCNALKIGTDTQGSFRNFLIRRCVLGGIREGMRHVKPLGADSGVSWEMVDGGTVERLMVSDCEINDARSPLFLRMDNRGRVMPGQDTPEIGTLRSLAFEHLRGSRNGSRGSYFLGILEKSIEQVWLSDIHFCQLPARDVPPCEEEYGEMYGIYPDAHMLENVGTGDAPAFGLWAKYVDGLAFSDYEVISEKDEVRPAFELKTGVRLL